KINAPNGDTWAPPPRAPSASTYTTPERMLRELKLLAADNVSMPLPCMLRLPDPLMADGIVRLPGPMNVSVKPPVLMPPDRVKLPAAVLIVLADWRLTGPAKELLPLRFSRAPPLRLTVSEVK